jgi:hypothetical protein
MSRRVLPVCLCLTLVLVAACAAPPNKEMDRAQGAIDAARAAGAEQYATTEYSAATAALESAQDAVAAGDYRLALNNALTSHERAQNAARETADTKARMRADVERAISEADMLIAQAQARLAAARRARVSPGRLAAPADDLASVSADLQKARESVSAGDYLAATAMMEGIRGRIEKVLEAVTTAAAPQSARRRR